MQGSIKVEDIFYEITQKKLEFITKLTKIIQVRQIAEEEELILKSEIETFKGKLAENLSLNPNTMEYINICFEEIFNCVE